MNKVHILSPEVINKIAAGEVIERPASVVKELVENALDAQTKSIEINLAHAGKSLIYVKDTGTGIEPDDIERIFYRHSTSKIQNIDDLSRICSLGFRGEALYSISAVADITLRSKTKSNQTGWEIHLRGGEKLNLCPVSMPEGTEIEVRELFLNIPARKKFLKTDTTELQQILNLFIPYTLLHPECRFILIHHNKTILNLPSEENHITRIKKALNLNPEHILEIKKDFPDKNISIHLFLGNINIQRPRKDMQYIFVNSRPVHNHSISFHINQIYKLIFPPEVNPFFYLHMLLPPENIDANIHPTKREVKIKDESTLISLLRILCEQTLMSHGKAKQIEGSIFSYKTEPVTVSELPYEEYKKDSREEQFTFSQEKTPVSPRYDDLKNKLYIARYIGTFLNKYLFFEAGTSLLIIDQHAAQERVTYEQLIQQIQSGRLEIQRLLTPFIIPLSPQELLAWENLKDVMERIGLQTTLWDNANIALHSHPQLIKKPEVAVRNVLSEKDRTGFDTDIIVRRACRNSVMAGEKMASEEVQYLRNKLIECNDPFVCPHGRPTVIEIKDKIFEKQFLRE